MSLLRSFHTPRSKSEFVRRVAPRRPPAGADRPCAGAISNALVAETSQDVTHVNFRVQLATRTGAAQLADSAQSTSKLTSLLASPIETSL